MNKYLKYVPGLIFVYLVSKGSMVLNDWLAPYINLEALTIAIILGIIYNNTAGTHESLQPGAKFALKKLLKLGIILLGFKLNIQKTLELGPRILIMVVLFIPFVLVLSYLLGKVFKVNNKLSTLIGVGSSICGASAIVAMAPCINADDDDAIISVSIVSLLGAIGVLFYSTVMTKVISDPVTYGIWSGLSLQGVAHAIAAAMAKGDISYEVGTIVKVTRVLMLVPVSVALGFIYNRDNTTEAKAKFPVYILLFIVAGVVNSLGIIPANIVSLLTSISKLCIIMAMTGMGLAVDFKSIVGKGLQSLKLGTVLFLIIAVSSLAMIRFAI